MSDIVERPDEACPMCEGKPMEPGQFCIAGCRDGMVRWTSANVLRNVRPFYDADQRKIREQAAEITRLRDEVERLEANLALRDSFIVAQGMWSEFVEQLPFKHSIAVTREGKTKVARAALDG